MKKKLTEIFAIKRRAFLLFPLILMSTTSWAQNDVIVGTTYPINIQRQGTDAHGFILHNAKTSNGTTFQWSNSHPSFGSRGLLFSYLSGITFYADNAATTGSSTFTPTPRFFIGNNGNVGVGTTSPRGVFDVGAAGDIYMVGDPNGNSQTGYLPGHLFLSPYAGGNITYLQARRLNNTGTTSLRIRTYNSGTMTEAVHIEGNGNVGIGTTTPTAKLDVISTDDFHLQFRNPNTGGIDWKIGGSASNWVAGAGKFIITNTSSDLASFVIDNQKRVGIGIVNPETRLHVADGAMTLDGANPTIYTGSGSSALNRYLQVANTLATPTPAGVKVGGLLVSDAYAYANPSANNLIVKGVVGIGTPLTSNPNNYSLQVNGKINATGIYLNDQPLSASPWVVSGTNLYYTNPVGIGAPLTTNPNNYSLAVTGKLNASQLFVNDVAVVSSQWVTAGSSVSYNGPVGIGTTTGANPNNYGLIVNGKINATELYTNDQRVVSSQWTTAGSNVYFNGAVGIGTSNPGDFQFAVNGNVGAKGVRVTKNSTAWPDYVFAKQYRLPSLKEVEKFIEANHHLENVPSATEVEKDGHDLGEMDAILLKKLEELTLYVIQQQKEIELLKKKLEERK